MHTPRILAVAVALAVSLAGPRPLHAQEVDEYTSVRADADLVFVMHGVGEAYNAAHARLMAHPELALTRVYEHVGRNPGLTATERERLATLAEALAGAQARAQIMDPPLRLAPADPPPPAGAPEGPPSANETSVPKSPPPGTPSWRPLIALGAVFLGSGALVSGVGVHVVRQRFESATTKGESCGCVIVGAAFVGGGLLFVGLGTWMIAHGAKNRREWKESARKNALKLSPSVGRSARGTWTGGLELRF
jgi:hypothetical protein